jgi:mycoredoxin-dependent peroxiredoxin
VKKSEDPRKDPVLPTARRLAAVPGTGPPDPSQPRDEPLDGAGGPLKGGRSNTSPGIRQHGGMSLSVGDRAPEFSLPDQDKQVVSLADLQGTPVLVVFYPFAFSGICTGELCQLRDELAVYTDAGVKVLAISTDPVFSLKAFKEKEGFDFPLLSDFWPHGATAQAYDAFNEKAGMALRGTFLVDAEGKIAFAEVNAPGDAREQSGWKDAVAKLNDEAA